MVMYNALMPSTLTRLILASPERMPFLIGAYAGMQLTGARVQEIVTNTSAQVEAISALHERFHTPFLLTAMDLSVEAEAFGCEIRFGGDEIPTAIGRRVSSVEEIDWLPVPEIGAGRTRVYLETAAGLVKQAGSGFVLGGMIGPFSLAARIFGVSELLEATISDPGLVESLLDKCEAFLTSYVLAFRACGAAGVIMAEPAAGLMSPRGLARFSGESIRRINESTRREDFTIIYHNCGARLAHLPRILEMGVEICHFGQPMDLPGALAQSQGSTVLCGNLDPASVFLLSTEQEVVEKTRALLDSCRQYPGFVPSSGCDLPPDVPIENVEAFYRTVREG